MKLAIDFETLEQATLSDTLAGGTLGDVISSAMVYVFPIAGFILLLYLILAGYQYLTSMGDPKAIQRSRSNMTWAIIGFIVIFSAYWVVQFVGRVLGIDKITDLFG